MKRVDRSISQDFLEAMVPDAEMRREFEERYYDLAPGSLTGNPQFLSVLIDDYLQHDISTLRERSADIIRGVFESLLLARTRTTGIPFEHVYKSARTIKDFMEVFRELCAVTLFKGEREFSLSRLEIIFTQLKSVTKQDPSIMNVYNFVEDVVQTAGVMEEQDCTYSFLLDSFQEYFFADYYFRQIDESIDELSEYFSDLSHTDFLKEEQTLSFLYTFAPKAIEEKILLPYLESLFKNTEDVEDGADNDRRLDQLSILGR